MLSYTLTNISLVNNLDRSMHRLNMKLGRRNNYQLALFSRHSWTCRCRERTCSLSEMCGQNFKNTIVSWKSAQRKSKLMTNNIKAKPGSGFYEMFCIFANMSCLCIHLVILFNLPCKNIFVME